MRTDIIWGEKACGADWKGSRIGYWWNLVLFSYHFYVAFHIFCEPFTVSPSQVSSALFFPRECHLWNAELLEEEGSSRWEMSQCSILSQVVISYPAAMLNAPVQGLFTNHQYHNLQEDGTYTVTKENSIYFEVCDLVQFVRNSRRTFLAKKRNVQESVLI